MFCNCHENNYLRFLAFQDLLNVEFFTLEPRTIKRKNRKKITRSYINIETPVETPVRTEQTKAKRCCYCGLIWKNSHKCNAINRYCTKCGEKGHFSRVCNFLGETTRKNNGINVSETVKTEKKVTTTQQSESTTKKEVPIDEMMEMMKKVADTLYEQKKYDLASMEYSKLIERYPNVEVFYGNRAACYIMVNRYMNALNDAKKAIELNPTYLKGHVRVLKSAMASGNLFEAEAAMVKLEELDPDNAFLISERKKIGEIRIYLQNNDDASMKKNYDEALKNIDKALAISTHCVAYKIKKGEYLALLERYKDAEIIANEILNDEPSNVDAKYILGLCIYQSDVEKAVDYFHHILRLVPDDPKICAIFKKAKQLNSMKKNGNNAFKTKNYNKAYELYTKALTIDPNNRGMKKRLYFNQSQASYKLGKIQRSIEECTQALAIDPNYVSALMRRGTCYIDQKEYEDAVDDLRRACEIDSGMDCRNLLKKAEKLLDAANSDYHGILGVKRSASLANIKKAYKEKALLHHPDRHSNSSLVEKTKNEKKFKTITRAYRILMNRPLSKSNSRARTSSSSSNDSDETSEYEWRYYY